MDQKNFEKYGRRYDEDERENKLRTHTPENLKNKRFRYSDQNRNKFFGFKHLEELSDKEPSEIVFVVCDKSNGFMDLFKQNKDPDWLYLLMKITAKICTTDFFENKHYILSEICCNLVFLDHLESYIFTSPTDTNEKRRENMETFFENCLLVCQTIAVIFPKSAAERLKNIVLGIGMAVHGIKINQNNIQMNDDILMVKINKILKQLNELKIINEVIKHENKFENAKPPENFRLLTVFPTCTDILSRKPFLRPNIVKGPYKSVEHYLDVQFRLLREDFFAPLRNGIKLYKESKENKQFKKIENIHVYRNVEFEEENVFVHDKLGCLLNFNKNNKLKINWDISNRFMFGSLLLFTRNDFDTFFMGIVTCRDRNFLVNGQIVVELIDVARPPSYLSFTMVESVAYFEPYKCAMRALQNMDTNNFPMEKYIISASNNINPPDYLNDLSVRKYYFNDKIVRFNILNDDEWPPKEKFALDEMQYEAFKAALTKEFSVIQGPPGTGKTFIGLKIVDIIIKNVYDNVPVNSELRWHPRKNLKPIMIVCFTNHALDQFMEGIIKFTQNVVRIGGQSKSEIINQYNLKKVTKDRNCANKSFQRLKTSIQDIQHKIVYLKKCNEFISENCGVLELFLLKNNMPVQYHNFFKDPMKYLYWLFQDYNYFNFDPIQFLMRQKLIHLNYDWEKFLKVTNHSETEDPGMDLKVCDVVVYCLTLRDVKNTSQKYIQELENCKSSTTETNYSVKCSRKNISNCSNRQQLNYELYCINRIHSYFEKMLALAGNNLNFYKIPKNLDQLPIRERWLLYFSWVNSSKNIFNPKILKLENQYNDLYKPYAELKELENIEVLNSKHVVAMTTTGAAQHRALLEALQSPIVIVEEAAEVLEAHIVSSLTRHCRHLILIGDHKQLRPNNLDYKLAKNYHIDISLFERMVNSDVPYYTLNEQHRMRPELSSLVTPTIYPNLLNHESVFNRPHVRGVNKDLFFLNHNHYETEVEEISSKSNDHEAFFLIAFARHLLKQGYKYDQVTILTTYKGQMFKLRSLQKLHPILCNLKIQVVDNYQGEECDIILLSLVRSNESGKVGYLKTENRTCVALTRAKIGLFIMGNMENLYNSGDLWKKIKKTLVDQNSYGDELTLECAVHKGVFTKISNSDDFNPMLEGGCTTLCKALLRCGHYCSSICHVMDRDHQEFLCQEMCTRSCENNHPCDLKCSDKCKKCLEPVLKTLPCGHQSILSCYIDPENFKCQEKVDEKLEECGHEIIKHCYEKEPKCTFKCFDRLECGHSCELNCHKTNDPEHLKYECLKPCEKNNKNCSGNHKCIKKCYEECSFCTIKVDKILNCGHLNKQVSCGDDVKDISCSSRLECNRMLKCGHKCQSQCFKKCPDCKIEVTIKLPDCGHEIKVKCKTAFEKRVFCTKKCAKTLTCGHKCMDLCRNECSSNNCKQLVMKDNKKLACGHSKFLTYCCDKDKEPDANDKHLLSTCQEPCLKKLCCGDICSGTCGQCKQGRLHIPCKEKCNKVNPCNHVCDYPCKEKCPPCLKRCSYSCTHSKCTRLCGVQCIPCKESCVWKCEHFACTKKCSDYCDRLPCYEPCSIELKCKHNCIGYCGEPCPPLCRICNHDEVTTIIFGNEDEPNARFIYLEDCKHTIESKALEQWINQKDGEIAFKQCPLCKTPILKTLRFKNHLIAIHTDISKIKKKLYGKNKVIQNTKEYVLTSINLLNDEFACIENISENLKNLKKLWYTTCYPLSCYNRYKMNYNLSLKAVDSCKLVIEFTKKFFAYKERIIKITDKQIKSRIVEHFDWLLTVAFNCIKQLSNQQNIDINLEMVRGARLIGLCEILNNDGYKSSLGLKTATAMEVKNLVDKMEAFIVSCERYDPTKDEAIQLLHNVIKLKFKDLCTITYEERKMIHAAMSVSFHMSSRAQGHWLKCKNNHIYCITECGGPMQVAECPECGVKIGGNNHAYVEGTLLASEMDGARHKAWSEGNNMGNYFL